MRVSLFWVDIRHIHHNAPHAGLLLPDPNVAATLDHVLRVVCDFVSPVCVTEIAGARHVAVDRLPRDVAFGFCQCLNGSLFAE
jgi:hypothetical protein